MSAKVFITRTIVAIVAVLSLAVHIWTSFAPFEWLGLVFYAVCFVMYAKALFFALTKTKRVTADLLVVTVMIVSLLAGQPLSGALVAWFISMGLAISWTIIERTQRKIKALTKERRRIVRVVRNEKIMELPVEEVCAGDTAIVPSGEMIPVDGEIIEGPRQLTSLLLLVNPFQFSRKSAIPSLQARSASPSSFMYERPKPETGGFLQVMAKEIEEQLKVKPRIHRTADTIVQFFISGVVLFAIGVFLFTGGLTGDVYTGLMRMAAVTAVACPCAWALSVPTAFAASIGGLSSRGILVSGGLPWRLLAGQQQWFLIKRVR
ncbi:MAG: hypothetical protein RQM92_11605 [Candidatus Syntrophopropionicum ammoniitolerans]